MSFDLWRAEPTAPVITVDTTISNSALIPTKVITKTRIFLPSIFSFMYSVLPKSTTSAVMKKIVFIRAVQKPVIEQAACICVSFFELIII